MDILYLRPCQPTECPAVLESVVVDVGTEKCPGVKQIGQQYIVLWPRAGGATTGRVFVSPSSSSSTLESFFGDK